MYDEREIGPVTLKVARWATDLSYEEIPGKVLEHEKRLILDGLGSSVLGSSMDIGKVMFSYAGDVEGKPEATIFGRNKKVLAGLAALVNGSNAHATNCYDTHRWTLIHTNVFIPQAAIAVAEKEGIGGKEVITSIVGGNEVCLRAGLAVHVAREGGWQHPGSRGWHPTGAVGGLGASVAAGKLLGLDVEKMVQAVVLGGDQPIGLFRSTGKHMGKRFHAGKVAATGVESAYLSRKGFIAGYKIFEEGLCAGAGLISPVYDLDAVTRGLGSQWETAKVAIGGYPTKRSFMANLDALFHILEAESLKYEDVKRVRVMNPLLDSPRWQSEFFAPMNETEAQNSLPYAISAALHDGEYSYRQLTREKYTDPEILGFARDRVEVLNDKELAKLVPEKYPGAVEVFTKDGRKFFKQIDYALGEPENPLSTEQVVDKFRRMTSHILGKEKAERVIEMVEGIEKLKDIQELTEALRP